MLNRGACTKPNCLSFRYRRQLLKRNVDTPGRQPKTMWINKFCLQQKWLRGILSQQTGQFSRLVQAEEALSFVYPEIGLAFLLRHSLLVDIAQESELSDKQTIE